MLGAISRHSEDRFDVLLASDPLTGHPNPRMLTRVDAGKRHGCAHHGETTTDIGRDWDDLTIPDLDDEYDEDLDDEEYHSHELL